MTLNDLARMLDLPPRQVRYLIAEGVIPPAKTLGRGADGFDAIHLEAGHAFKALAAEGLGVRKAKALLDARAQLSAMVVEVEATGRRRLRFGPVEVLVDDAALAGLTGTQFDGIMAALRDRLVALRQTATDQPAPRASRARRSPKEDGS